MPVVDPVVGAGGDRNWAAVPELPEEARDLHQLIVEPVPVTVEPVFPEALPVVAQEHEHRVVERPVALERRDELPEAPRRASGAIRGTLR